MPHKDPEKRREWASRWRTQNPDRVREQTRLWRARHPNEAARKQRLRQDLVNDRKLSRGCLLCGERRHYSALDLHHIDPATKHPKLRVGRGRAIASLPMSQIPAELAKCVVLCATCHRLVEAGVLQISGASRPEEV